MTDKFGYDIIGRFEDGSIRGCISTDFKGRYFGTIEGHTFRFEGHSMSDVFDQIKRGISAIRA